MVKHSDNIVHRLLDRQICNRPSSTQLHRVRKLYENIVPSHTVYDVECPPDCTFRKFTNDGQYLVAFSRNGHDLIVFRFNWFSYSTNQLEAEDDYLPARSRKFESFFTHHYSVPLASGANEAICKDFLLTTENSAYAIFATSTLPQNEPPLAAGAVPGIPAAEKTSILVVRLSDGAIVDERVFHNDLIQLSHNMGVFMYDDLLTVLSVRYQCIHILQIRESGMLVDVRKIGQCCREDDQLLIDTQLQKEAEFQKEQSLFRQARGGGGAPPAEEELDLLKGDSRSASFDPGGRLDQGGSASDVASASAYPPSSHSVTNSVPQTRAVVSYIVSSRGEEGSVSQDDITAPASSTGSRNLSPVDSNAPPASTSSILVDVVTSAATDSSGTRLLCGIKQRLLSYIFRTLQGDPLMRIQRLKRFYYLFPDYVDLVMWKVQFLDRHHLLIKFGSVDGVVSRSSEAPQQTAFFVVYNYETTQVVEFQQNSSEELLQLLENFADHFRVSQRYPLLMRYITSYSNNTFLREQLRKQRSACRSGSSVQAARRSLASLPVKAQSQSPSAYFDHSLFQFDEKLISASDRHRPCMEHPIKFISRRHPNALKFKINPGPESGTSDGGVGGGRMKRVAAFIFHPVFPFAMSIQQSYTQPTVINFHFRK